MCVGLNAMQIGAGVKPIVNRNKREVQAQNDAVEYSE